MRSLVVLLLLSPFVLPPTEATHNDCDPDPPLTIPLGGFYLYVEDEDVGGGLYEESNGVTGLQVVLIQECPGGPRLWDNVVVGWN